MALYSITCKLSANIFRLPFVSWRSVRPSMYTRNSSGPKTELKRWILFFTLWLAISNACTKLFSVKPFDLNSYPIWHWRYTFAIWTRPAWQFAWPIIFTIWLHLDTSHSSRLGHRTKTLRLFLTKSSGSAASQERKPSRIWSTSYHNFVSLCHNFLGILTTNGVYWCTTPPRTVYACQLCCMHRVLHCMAHDKWSGQNSAEN